MKREDAINKLIDAVYTASFNDVVLEKSEADTLLNLIEKMGFLPPTLPEDMTEVMAKVYKIPVYNMWEEEFMQSGPLVDGLNKYKALTGKKQSSGAW